MLSKYFEFKTNTKEFKDDILSLIDNLKEKKVLLYGAGEGFIALNKKYNFKENWNIVAIADKKFEKKRKKYFEGIKTVIPDNIPNEDFDFIVITNETTRGILNYLCYRLEINENKIKRIFKEDIEEETFNFNYLFKLKFNKTLPRIIKKLKGKRVLLYGAGAFLQLIKKHFDLSGLDIIGISDKRFEEEKPEEWQGYKTYCPDEIKELNPDYVMVTTKFYVSIIKDLYYNKLKDTDIKIAPLVKKPFITILKEIWRM